MSWFSSSTNVTFASKDRLNTTTLAVPPSPLHSTSIPFVASFSSTSAAGGGVGESAHEYPTKELVVSRSSAIGVRSTSVVKL
ncbi:hypothetical protein OsI_15317 [Oryza sativa Indica Group]|uniref:Uncharacterized protein n=1 Tax=Oryza sativa subsp. indica TaxID=39946 RepID=B8AS76_ORYSI|nr:hypothetical protein OsI_15317 [Oryza sativa Indica Group]